jgi:hypothetical protein
MMLVQNLHSYHGCGRQGAHSVHWKMLRQGSFPALWAIEGPERT